MTNRKKTVLGRNLSSMLSQTTLQQVQRESRDELRDLPLDMIRPGRYQPRSVFDPEKLAELADSIRAQGIVQPVVVRPVEDEQFELIAGERRWRAAQMAGIANIPAVIRDVPDEVSVAMALIENIQRENLNPLEEARALDRLMREFELTQQQVAEAIGRSRSAVANLLRLNDLNEDVKTLVEERALDMGHARALLALTGATQSEAAREVAKHGLTARETEALVRRMLSGTGKGKGKGNKKPLDPNIRTLQDDLAAKLGAKVTVQHGAKGKGKLVIEYHSLDELDGILGHIK
jgi:ParB family chromosome partitioning protein